MRATPIAVGRDGAESSGRDGVDELIPQGVTAVSCDLLLWNFPGGGSWEGQRAQWEGSEVRTPRGVQEGQ